MEGSGYTGGETGGISLEQKSRRRWEMADSRFTSTALGAIRLAQENAVRLGHCYVGSEHLLLGLACQEYSLAARLLGEAGADSLSRSISSLMAESFSMKVSVWGI